MKKFCVFLICLAVSIQYVWADNQHSYNPFSIRLKDIPEGGKLINNESGLSDGEVTAITLGSIFAGLVAGGSAYYFYKKGHCLAGACFKSKDSPLIPMCFRDRDENDAKLNKNIYLERLFKEHNLDKTCKKKYIIISDTFIKNNSYHRRYFKLDKKYTKIRVIQYSKPFKIMYKKPSLETKIYLDDKEMPLVASLIDSAKGIVIKDGKLISDKMDNYFFDISLISEDLNTIYALVLEFE